MSHLVTPRVECVESEGSHGRFVAEPLDRGFGITVGNALRRVLLGSLRGAAVTWIRIEGIQHEFSTMAHMKEDATEFLLNVKGLRFRPLTGQEGRLVLEVEGEKVVRAGDIKSSTDFEIANPDLYLATLDSPKAKLYVEFNVALGKGYVPASHGDGLPIGTIPVDAIYTPVQKVSYSVEPVRTGQYIGYEKLLLDIWTDGTMSAAEALSQSSQILKEQFATFLAVVQAGCQGRRRTAGGGPRSVHRAVRDAAGEAGAFAAGVQLPEKEQDHQGRGAAGEERSGPHGHEEAGEEVAGGVEAALAGKGTVFDGGRRR